MLKHEDDRTLVSNVGETLEQLIWQINQALQTPDFVQTEAAEAQLRALRSQLWSTCKVIDAHLPADHATRLPRISP